MVRTIDLDQFADMFTPKPRLLDAFALRPWQPDAGLPHPAAQCLSRQPYIMTLASFSAASVGPKVRVVLADQLDGMITNDIRQAVVRRSTRRRFAIAAAAIAVSLQQPMGLARAG
jgi:hypothetical protein